MNEHLTIILDKMHEVIGAEWDSNLEHFEFDAYSWSYPQERFFKDWMMWYLDSYEGARVELMGGPSTNLRRIEKVVNEFCFNYGWKNDNS